MPERLTHHDQEPKKNLDAALSDLRATLQRLNVGENEAVDRVFGFAQSIESSAAPLTAFAVGPIAQYFFIPTMQEGGRGANLIGNWFGTGDGRGIALVFLLAGAIGLAATVMAFRSRAYTKLSANFSKVK